MEKIKVLLVAGPLNMGGIENQLMHLLRQADKSVFQIDFTATNPDSCYRQEIGSLGGTFHHIPRMSLRNPFPYFRILTDILKRGEYDIIHSHELFHSGIVMLLAKLAGVPCRFVHAHNWDDGDGSGRKRPLIRTVYNAVMRFLINRFSTCRIACSTPAGKFLYGEKADFHLLFNSVDTAKFLDRYDDREQGEFTEDGWTNVLHVGRVTAVKNQLFLTAVAAELRRRGKKIRILCAGAGDEGYEARVRSAVRQKELDEHLLLLGMRSDISVLARKCSAFALPSRYEGMPLALIEAQAAGLPCVCADTFSREVDFGIGSVCWLPPDADAGRWADAITGAIEHGRADKADVVWAVEEKGFDSDSFARKLCALYADAMKEGRP